MSIGKDLDDSHSLCAHNDQEEEWCVEAPDILNEVENIALDMLVGRIGGHRRSVVGGISCSSSTRRRGSDGEGTRGTTEGAVATMCVRRYPG